MHRDGAEVDMTDTGLCCGSGLSKEQRGPG